MLLSSSYWLLKMIRLSRAISAVLILFVSCSNIANIDQNNAKKAASAFCNHRWYFESDTAIYYNADSSWYFGSSRYIVYYFDIQNVTMNDIFNFGEHCSYTPDSICDTTNTKITCRKCSGIWGSKDDTFVGKWDFNDSILFLTFNDTINYVYQYDFSLNEDTLFLRNNLGCNSIFIKIL